MARVSDGRPHGSDLKAERTHVDGIPGFAFTRTFGPVKMASSSEIAELRQEMSAMEVRLLQAIRGDTPQEVRFIV